MSSYQVTGAGDNSYDGIYVETGTFNGVPAYTNGSKWLYWNVFSEPNPGGALWVMNPTKTEINSPGQMAPYFTFGAIDSTWDFGITVGTPPAPTVVLYSTDHTVSVQDTIEAEDTASAQVSKTIIASGDCFVNAGQPTTNFENHEKMVLAANNWFWPNISRGLVKFDLSSIADGVTITSVIVSLRTYDWHAYGGNPLVDLKKNLADFTTSSVTWNSRPSTAADATATVEVNNWETWYSWTVTSDVGTTELTNNTVGWTVIQRGEFPNRAALFYHTEISDSSKRPKLVITFTQLQLGTDYDKDLADTISASDAVIKAIGKGASDTINSSDTPVTDLRRQIVLNFNDDVGISDGISTVDVHGSDLSKNLADTIAVSDSASPSLTRGKQVYKYPYEKQSRFTKKKNISKLNNISKTSKITRLNNITKR